jgi:hypothetical protein
MTLQEFTPENVLAELSNDPVGMGYGPLTGDLRPAHALLHDETKRTVYEPVYTREHPSDGMTAQLWLMNNNIWDKLDAARDNAAFPEDFRRKIEKFFETINTLPRIDVRNSEITTYGPQLIFAQIITQAELEAFQNLGARHISRAMELWGQSVGIGYMARVVWPGEFAAHEAERLAAQTALQTIEGKIHQLETGVYVPVGDES